jgi:pimeloyl-ACP methyl ester carboxylesterase
MRSVVSKDGTRIACIEIGAGSPLVLVHGTSADHTRFGPVVPKLQERFTVFAMDRRGRGASGDSSDYTLEREAEDVAAVIDNVAGAGKACLLGHSFGAIVCLEALVLTDRIEKLVLYEPLIPVGPTSHPPDAIARFDALLAKHEREAVVEIFLSEIVKVPATDVATLKSLPSWPSRVAGAHTIPREMRAEEAFSVRAERFASVRVPTLLLLGGDSPASFKAAIEAVARAVPSSRVEVLPGQKHMAMNTAPEMFATTVLGFFSSADGVDNRINRPP